MWLRFQMTLQASNDLQLGTLCLMDAANNVQDTFSASSGAPRWQAAGCEDKVAKGPIPACSSVGITAYAVSTAGSYEPNTEGVRGMFFPITPDPVVINGVKRGDFGVHRDTDFPGTAGCVGIEDADDWTRLQEFLKTYNFSHISLVVEYN